MRIHGLTASNGGCRFYRIEQPFECLRRRGHDVSWSTAFDPATAADIDLFVFQLTYEETTVRLIEWLVSQGKPVAFEVDDNVLCLHEVVDQSTDAWSRPGAKERLFRTLNAATITTVTTRELAEVYAPYARNIWILPNGVPDWMVENEKGALAHPVDYTIGYSCSPSHIRDVEHIHSTVHDLMCDNPAWRFRWYGPRNPVIRDPKTALELPMFPNQDWILWTDNVEAYHRQLFGTMSVGIAPLHPDLPFNRGKSGIKALEYGATGVPVIASSYPQYVSTIRHGVTGFLAETPEEWRFYLNMLGRDEDLRLSMGFEGRMNALQNTAMRFSTLWEEAYLSAIYNDGKPIHNTVTLGGNDNG